MLKQLTHAQVWVDDQDKALEYGRKVAESELGKRAQVLNGLAWAIVDPGDNCATIEAYPRTTSRIP